MVSRNVPRLRFKIFGDEWENEKLGSVSTIQRGASPRPITNPKWFDNDSNIGWIRISDVTEQNGKIRHLSQHISELGQKKTRVLKEPHLLLSIAASVGKPVINYVPTGVHDGFLIFKNIKFDMYFMFYFLEYFQEYWQKYGQPGSQVNLNASIVRQQFVGLPSLTEQQHIDNFFSKLDHLIDLHSQKLEQLKKLKRGYLQKMFPQKDEKVPRIRFSEFHDDWKEETLDKLVSIRTGNKNAEDDIPDGKYVFFDRSSDIKHLNSYDFDGKVIVYPGEGANFLPRKYEGKYSLHQRAYGLYDFRNINSEYLYQYLLTQNHTFLKYAVGTTSKSLRGICFKKVIVSCPSLEEQQQIANLFSRIDNLINSTDKKIQKLKRQKKAYLQKMFI